MCVSEVLQSPELQPEGFRPSFSQDFDSLTLGRNVKSLVCEIQAFE